ncbi:NADH dehydrogenase [ubiquinone] 1 beta subcomplex subunit 4 [Procambarus clarkii]|uniref:NADH dehydrogenase [ubiquinone] 1 beta subcomplex subunit 4 n=1 Tax=Procambarus clarkii TaxID=6728 RepID=UPI00374483C2
MAGTDGPTSSRAVEERAAVRAAVKREYLKQVTNPHRHASGEGGYLFDPALQRFMSMKATQYDHFKPTPRASRAGFFLVFVPIATFCYMLKTSRDKFEHKCRTGQVSYASREFKFV